MLYLIYYEKTKIINKKLFFFKKPNQFLLQIRTEDGCALLVEDLK